MPLSSGQITSDAATTVAESASVTPLTRVVPLDAPAADRLIFHSWGTQPWTTQSGQDKRVFSLKNAVKTNPTFQVVQVGNNRELRLYENSVLKYTIVLTPTKTLSQVVTELNGTTAAANSWVFSTYGGNFPDRLSSVRVKTYGSTACASTTYLYASGTADGDALAIHPRYRVCPFVHLRRGAIDYVSVPGAPQYGFNVDTTPQRAASRLYQCARWMAWNKGMGAGGGNNAGLYYMNSSGHDALTDQYLHGSPYDGIGCPDNVTDYGPSQYHHPFCAQGIVHSKAFLDDVASILKEALDTPTADAPSGYCYPEGLIHDTELHYYYFFSATWSKWQQGNGTWDGSPLGLGDNSYPGGVIHGNIGLTVVVGTPGGTLNIVESLDNSNNYTGSIGYVPASGSPVLVALTKTKTLGEVATEFNAVVGSEIALILGPGMTGTEPANLHATSKTFPSGMVTWNLWRSEFATSFYKGWLELLIDDPTLADIARRSSETIYREWTGSSWADRTFDYWWASMTSKGLHNFTRTATMVSQTGRAQNHKQRIVITNADASTEFRINFGGNSTAWITYDNKADAATVQAEIDKTALNGKFTVTQNTALEYYILECIGALAGADQALVTVDLQNQPGGCTASVVTHINAAASQNWATTAVGDGTLAFDQSTGGTVTRKKRNLFEQEIWGLTYRTLDYRYYEASQGWVQKFPGLRLVGEYNMAPGGATPTTGFCLGINDPNSIVLGGRSQCAANPSDYRAYADDTSYTAQYYSRNYKTSPWQNARDASLNLFEMRAAQIALHGQPSYVWVNEPGDNLGWAGWKTTEFQLNRQLEIYNRYNRNGSGFKCWDIVLYVDVDAANSGNAGGGVRGDPVTGGTTYTSDQMILRIINESINMAAKNTSRPNFRR